MSAVAASDVSFNEGILRLAAVHEREVHFRYAKAEGDVIELRALIPRKVREVGIDKFDPDFHTTVTGFDPDREQVRHYRLDRIKGEVKFA